MIHLYRFITVILKNYSFFLPILYFFSLDDLSGNTSICSKVPKGYKLEACGAGSTNGAGGVGGATISFIPVLCFESGT